MEDPAWSRPSHWRHQVSHLRSTARGPAPIVEDLFGDRPTSVVWSRVAAGGFIAPHIDHGPYFRRWQIPVRAAGWWWDPARGEFEPAEPFEVQHWLPHAVWNPTGTDRIHLVVDLLDEVVHDGEQHLTMVEADVAGLWALAAAVSCNDVREPMRER